jgi:hypothetical protein
MSEERKDKRTRNYILMRAIKDYGMGALILGFGVFFSFPHVFGADFAVDPFFRYLFAGMCALYGGFRIYRGYQKNYFDNE